MQKLELRNHLHKVVLELRSNQIANLLDQPNIKVYDLMNLVIESKAGFDKALTNPETAKVLEQLKLENCYETKIFAKLMGYVGGLGDSTHPRKQFLGNPDVISLYAIHKTLADTFKFVDKLLITNDELFDDHDLFDISLAEEKGNLMLQVIDEENVDLKKLSLILNNLYELIEVIYLLFDKIESIEFKEHPKISMIDNGSDINIVIKLPSKATKLIAQLLKELWDVIINNKSYRLNKKLSDVEKSLSVMGKITEAQNKGLIDEGTAIKLKKGVFNHAKIILEEGTLTKAIVIESNQLNNRQILIEQSRNMRLEQGKPSDEYEDETEPDSD